MGGPDHDDHDDQDYDNHDNDDDDHDDGDAFKIMMIMTRTIMIFATGSTTNGRQAGASL